MIGTLINAAAILIGGLIGLVFGHRIPQKTQDTLVNGLGLFMIGYGVMSFMKTQNMLIPLVSLLIGTIFGEWWKIQDHLDALGGVLEKKFLNGRAAKDEKGSRFITGFVTASLLFSIGPMAILGAFQDGLTGDYQMLAIKALIDGMTSIAFAASLGVGVLFSAGLILLFQGGIALAAQVIGRGLDMSVINEITSVGGVVLIGLGVSSLLKLKPIRTGSFLPAIFVSIVIVLLLQHFGVGY